MIGGKLGCRPQFVERWENTLEPFFVKNLENVQGDERDVIFISTVYGPDATTGIVMNRFGPINSKQGHRRLNVLFTRAKHRVEVFTSMRPSDIRTDEKSQRGVHVLGVPGIRGEGQTRRRICEWA